MILTFWAVVYSYVRKLHHFPGVFFPIAENFKTDSGKNNTIETYLFEKLPRSQWYFCRH